MRTRNGLGNIYNCTAAQELSISKGVARGGPGVPVNHPPPPFVSLFLRKQPTIFRGENAMTILFDSV